MLQGDFASLRARRKIAQRLQSLRRGTLPDLVEDPGGIRVNVFRVPQPTCVRCVNQVLVGIETENPRGSRPSTSSSRCFRVFVDQSPFSAAVAQLQQRQPVLPGDLVAHSSRRKRRVGLAISTGKLAKSVVHWRRDLLRQACLRGLW